MGCAKNSVTTASPSTSARPVLSGHRQRRHARRLPSSGAADDYLLNIDGQKAGLWQGLYINLHGETVYGDSVNLFTGAIVPVNIGRAHPVFFGDETALTAVKFTQALSENLTRVRRENQYD